MTIVLTVFRFQLMLNIEENLVVEIKVDLDQKEEQVEGLTEQVEDRLEQLEDLSEQVEEPSEQTLETNGSLDSNDPMDILENDDDRYDLEDFKVRNPKNLFSFIF